MNASELISFCKNNAAALDVCEGKIRCKAPKGFLTADIIAALKEHKDEIIALLGKASDDGSIRAQARDGRVFPVSFSQQRLWFLDQFEPASALYNIPVALRFSGELDVTAAQRALQEIIRRHAVLRTHFSMMDGVPVQELAAEAPCTLQLENLEELSETEQSMEVQRLLACDAATVFNLATGPVLHARLLRLAADEHILSLVIHHIASDAWSMGVLVSEFVKLYSAYLQGQPSPLPELMVQYADFAVWQRDSLKGESLQRHIDFWRQHLDGAPERLTLPTDRPHPPVQSFAGGEITVQIPVALTHGLKELARNHELTLFMVLLSAWSLLLSRLAGQDEVVVGTAIANRQRAETAGLIGFFVNTLAIRVSLGADTTLASLLAQVKNNCLDAYTFQGLPFEQVVDVLRPSRSLSYNPVFQTMLSLDNTPLASGLSLPGLQVSGVEVQRQNTQFDLSLSLVEIDGELLGNIAYASDLFDARTVARFREHFLTLLAGMAADASQGSSQTISQLPLLSAEQRQQLLFDFNPVAHSPTNADAVEAAAQFSHQLVEQWAQRYPDAVAVRHLGNCLTYAQLNRRANQIAHYLRACGARPGQRIALCMNRGLDMLAGLLGILKSGAAYIPVDPAYPADRIAYVLADSAPLLILTEAAIAEKFASSTTEIFQFDDPADEAQLAAQPHGDLAVAETALSLTDTAYIIYTSGSTGLPKGVMVGHGHLNDTLLVVGAELGYGQHDIFPNLASHAFDISLLELLMPLVHGGTSDVLALDDVKDIRRLVGQTQDASFFHAVPSLMALWLDFLDVEGGAVQAGAVQTGTVQTGAAHYPQLRCLLVGGEAVPPQLLTRLRQRFPAAQVVELYGPTEASIVSSFYRASADPHPPAGNCIGRPFNGTRIFLLDQSGQAVPLGVTGEICIGGGRVAQGYLNRAELTAEKFIDCPLPEFPGLLYRTGDLGRYLPNGHIDYLGRNDDQVKIRGFRIEPGEISARLKACAGVKDAVVVAQSQDNGQQRLVAYVVASVVASGDEALSPVVLRRALAATLPEHMLPDGFVNLPALPMNLNGKLDKNALPVFDQSALAAKDYVAPRSATEKLLASIWSEVLGMEQIGIHDNFFEIGGHSFLAVSLIEKIRRAGHQIDVRSLFLLPSIAQLAQELGKGDHEIEVPANLIPPGCSDIRPDMLPLISLSAQDIALIVKAVPGGAGNIQDIYPLAPLQEGILFHHLLHQYGDPYLVPTRLAFDSRARASQFLDAMQTAINRHDILRTAIVWEGLPEPVQVVVRHAPMQIEEVRADKKFGNIEQQFEQAYNRRNYRLDLRQAPMIRVFLAEDDLQARWVMQIVMHHIICDHTTLDLLIEEIQAILSGQTEQLPPALPFRNFVAQTRFGISPAEHEAYFKTLLSGIVDTTAPFGLNNIQGDGSAMEETRQQLSAAFSQRIRQRSSALGVTPASLMHLAWSIVIANAARRNDIVFGTVMLGRMQGGIGADRVFGMFMNTLPVRTAIDGTSLDVAVRNMHTLLGQIMRHEHASMALTQKCSDIKNAAPLFTALLNYRHSPQQKVVVADAASAAEAGGISKLDSSSGTNYPLTLSVDDMGGQFTLTVQVSATVSAQRVGNMMHAVLENMMDALDHTPAMPLNRLSTLTPAGRNEILQQWNQVQENFTAISDAELRVPMAASNVLALFAQASQQYADRPALQKYADKHHEHHAEPGNEARAGVTLTYAELDFTSNQLANALLAGGAQKGAVVAILCNDAAAQIVATLGILKAGCVFASLDVASPPSRLGEVIAMIASDWIVADASCVQQVAGLFEKNAQNEQNAGLKHVIWMDQEAVTLPPFAESNGYRLSAQSGQAVEVGMRLGADDPCYIYFTSGSTGKPKAVLGRVAGLAHFIQWEMEKLNVNAHSVFSHITNPGFHVYLREIFTALCAGATLQLPTSVNVLQATALLDWIEASGTTVMHCVPSVFRLLLSGTLTDMQTADRLPALQFVVVGGGALTPADANRWFDLFGGRIRVLSLYGQTETTLAKFCYELPLSRIESAFIPMGKPIPGAQAIVLADNMDPCAIGEMGEIYVRTPYRSLGYYRQDQLNSAAFVRNPFTADVNDVLYKTGDFAIVLPDGNFRFMGRRDQQIKIRGIRIELGEIEAAVAALPMVREAAVQAVPGEEGELVLIAFVVLEKYADPQMIAHLRNVLLDILPRHMVPSRFIALEEMPVTANRKVDNAALLEHAKQKTEIEFVAPRTEVEQQLVQIWSSILKLDKIGVTQDFFAIGGDSLMAIQLSSKITEFFALNLPLSDIFSHPTIAQLAQLIGAGEVDEKARQAQEQDQEALARIENMMNELMFDQ